MTRYPLVRLGEVLTPSRREVNVEPSETYRTAGVLSYGKGLFAREPMLGAETKYTRLSPLREGQLVFARLSAWEGGIAVVPRQFDGMFVSQEFPILDVDRDRASSDYVAWLCRWSPLWDALMQRSRGLGSRVGARRLRVHTEQLLEVEVPLPERAEQLRIAAKLERVGSTNEQLARCEERWALIHRALYPALAQRRDLSEGKKQAAGWRHIPLGEVMSLASDWHQVASDAVYPNVGILSFGRGLFEKAPIYGSKTSARALNRIRSGQLIYSRLFAFEGAYAEVDGRYEGYFVSNEFPTFDMNEKRALAAFVAAYLRSPAVWAELATSSKGLGVRRQRVHPETLLAFRVWLPSIEDQRATATRMSMLAECDVRRSQASKLRLAIQPATLNQAFAGLL